MCDWEQLDSILHWIHCFYQDDSSFLQDPFLLLDCIAISKVFNSVSDEKIDQQSLKKIADNSWVNMLLNLRLIASKISPLLKENGIELSIDMSSIARKKDQKEFLKFLKYFLFYALKAPQRKNAIDAIRTLDKVYQANIQGILEEFMKKNNVDEEKIKQDKTKNESNSKLVLKENNLKEEIEHLKNKYSELEKMVNNKTKEIEQLNINASSKIEEKQNELKEKYQKEMELDKELTQQIIQSKEDIKNIQDKINELREKQNELTTEIQNDSRNDSTIQQLEARLLIQKQKIINNDSLFKDSKLQANDSIENIISFLKLDEKNEKIDQLQKEIAELQKQKTIKTAELSAMKSTFEIHNQKSSLALLKRISQLNEQMNETPLGQAKQSVLKLKRYCEKLKKNILKIKKEGDTKEHDELEKELQNMIERKAEESDLLAKKLSFLQSTLEQCNIKIQRLKLNTALQTHTNRLRRYKNCFNINE